VGVMAAGRLSWAGWSCRTQKKFIIIIFIFYSNEVKFILIQKRSFQAPKVEIRYGWEGFEIGNNFPYRKFLRFKMSFELKIREASTV
jgi:hypothetical protein